MAVSEAKQPSFGWALAFALVLWFALLWGLGFFLKAPQRKPPPVAAIDARLVELPEKKPAPVEKPRRPRAQPRVRALPKVLVRKPTLKMPVPPPPAAAPAQPDVEKPVRPLPTPLPTDAAPTDMESYIRQRQASRAAAESSDRGSAAKPAPDADDARMATIRRNLQVGTNGIFQILDLQPRTARFSFRAWTSTAANPRRETIDVDAGPGGDVELAVIRRMIELIREYYKGDFNWESDRLGRVVVLSARPVDNAQLEDFLMREFFGVARRNQAQGE